MKKKYLQRLSVCCLALLMAACSGKKDVPVADYQNPALPVDQRVEDLLGRMTLEEKADFIAGKDMWHFKGIERLNVPAIQVSDCGHGITIILDENGQMKPNATCFPTASAQAATWNKALIRELGAAMGREARSTGSSILLAPMVNIIRTPLNGRNFETFSEDPVLSGELGAAFINGVQSEDVGCVIKHFTANNQQAYQNNLNVLVDERTLREIYLPNFKIALEKSDPWGLMTAYNDLNGEQTSANKHILEDILKGEWAYPGFVVSDWNDIKTAESITTKLDIEMPGPGKFLTKANVLKAIEDGLLSEAELNDKVKRILRGIIKTKVVDLPKVEFDYEFNSPGHQELARKVAEDGIVLLKNEQVLPFKSDVKKLAVLGPNAAQARLGGGGSASVTPFYSVSPLQGIKNYCGDTVEIHYEEGCGLSGNLEVIGEGNLFHSKDDALQPGLKAEYFSNDSLGGTPDAVDMEARIDFSWGWASPHPGVSHIQYSARWTGQIKAPVSGDYKIGVSAAECGFRLYLNGELKFDNWNQGANDTFEEMFAAKSKQLPVHLEEGEMLDVRLEFTKKRNRNFIRLEWEVPGVDPVALAVKAAKECDAAVIFAGLSNFFEGGGNDRSDLRLPGEQNRLIREVAKVNPNTVVVLQNGAAVAMPWMNDVHAIVEAFYPGQEGGNAIANVLFGKVNPSGKLAQSFPFKVEDNPSFGNYPGTNLTVNYAEGIWVGYRYYENKDIPVLFPFGYGLSYTQFAYENLEITELSDSINVAFDIENTGQVAGAEVPQLYVHDVEASESRPAKELKAFEKVYLEPGEKRRVSMTLGDDAFAFFSAKEIRWMVEPGEFDLLVGSSSADIRLQGKIKK
ncbi:beta-glucosidase [Mangrovibacterium diazotrophicum]|uniref:Beta-glucosidase n=1 Tax=Mangrovibacterium diazotrophicum TaxID=1261403 RepID=A0A419VYQ9_9BACT|nr:glycoside hydrolase family 3 C-terminal domain-containing protein [Mangrovibacterium diazotrophicum]RKD88289.1 beta-glucosidase [Mangrovibacterium diazotrophicum]